MIPTAVYSASANKQRKVLLLLSLVVFGYRGHHSMLSPCVLNDRIQVHFQKHNTAFTVSEFQCLTETTNMSSQETCWKLWTSLGQKGIPDGNKKYTIKALIQNLYIDQGLLSDTQARKQGGRGGRGQTWLCIPQWHRNPDGHSFSAENRVWVQHPKVADVCVLVPLPSFSNGNSLYTWLCTWWSFSPDDHPALPACSHR